MSSPFHFTALCFKYVQVPLENDTLVPKWEMKILRVKVCLFISIKVCWVSSISGTLLHCCSGDSEGNSGSSPCNWERQQTSGKIKQFQFMIISLKKIRWHDQKWSRWRNYLRLVVREDLHEPKLQGSTQVCLLAYSFLQAVQAALFRSTQTTFQP